MPAAMPAAIRMRLSWFDSRITVASFEPIPAPIWAIGPSRPAEPPVPIVTAADSIFTSGTRPRTLPEWWW